MTTAIGPGKKYDEGKVRVDLLPIGALYEIARVLTFGANKYGANNWQNVSPRSRYYGAALRHLFARGRGEKIDPESGLPHLAHAACCILFLLSAEAGFDDPEAWEDDAEPDEDDAEPDEDDEEDEEDDTPKFQVGQRVEITKGPLKGWFGKITRVDAREGVELPLTVTLEEGGTTYKALDEVTTALQGFSSVTVKIGGIEPRVPISPPSPPS